MMMTQSQIFGHVGAPLSNVRWSWGAQRQCDGAVFLLVWQDESRRIEGNHYTLVDNASYFQGESAKLGRAERLGHIELIRAGAQSYMVMCLVVDRNAVPRSVASINDQEVFVGGKLIDVNGDTWLERIERRPLAAVR
jgi:hypothetical protein